MWLVLYSHSTKLEHNFIIVILSFLALNGLGEALKCLSCDTVAHPSLCKHVTTCYDNEKCGMETYISQDGSRLYSIGCVHRDTCAAGTNILTNGAPMFSSCHSCCDDHDLCNMRGCNATGFPVNRGPVCYSCEASPAGYTCPTIEHCEQHEVCYNDATLEFLTETFYTSGCRSKHHCANNGFDPLTSFVGKRGSSTGKADTNSNIRPAINKRSLKVCTDCCEGDLCNIQCKRTDTCHDDPDCQTLISSLPNLCSNHDLATKFCQRTCNLCPAVTSDTCGDLRVNCVYINQSINVCGTKLKAYEHGCLKHCGFCASQTASSSGPDSHSSTTIAPLVQTTTVLLTAAPTMKPTTTPTTAVPSTQPTAPPTAPPTTQTPGLPSTGPSTKSTAPPKTTHSPTRPSTVRTTQPTVPQTSKVTVIQQAVSSTAPTTAGFTFPLHPVFIPHTPPSSSVNLVLSDHPKDEYKVVYETGVSLIQEGKIDAISSREYRTWYFPRGCAAREILRFFSTNSTLNLFVAVQSNPVYTNGSRVVRGVNWNGGNEDGNGEGTIVGVSVPGVVTVIWDNGNKHNYSMGKDGHYELDVITVTSTATSGVSSHLSTISASTTTGRTYTMSTTNTPLSPINTSSSVSRVIPSSTTPTSVPSKIPPTSLHPSTSSPAVHFQNATVSQASTGTPGNSFTTNSMTQSTSTVQLSTTTVQANCPIKPPEVQHGYPHQVDHSVVLYKCYDGYRFEPVSQNVSRKVVCDVATQTWTKPLPKCTAVKSCTVQSDCLNNGSCDMNRHSCMCAPGYFNTNCDSVNLVLSDHHENEYNAVYKTGGSLIHEDGKGTGTVTLMSQVGWVRVHWANTDIENSYRFGTDGKYDIVPYNGTYIVPNLLTQPAQSTSPLMTLPTTSSVPLYGPALLDKMCIGCRVQRGRDWKWGNQDSNGLGTVLTVDKSGGWVKVEWDNGVMNDYRMGAENAYDLMLAP